MHVYVGSPPDQAIDERPPKDLLPSRPEGLPHDDLRHVLLIGERQDAFDRILHLESLKLPAKLPNESLDIANPVRNGVLLSVSQSIAASLPGSCREEDNNHS